MTSAGSRRAMAAVALLFFLKASYLALAVTPLWDVPDEIGHFAYASDLADGRGLAPAGQAVIPPELVARWKGSAGAVTVYNWAEVHPPGYHLIAALALRGARAVTPELEWQVRITRLTSAFFGAATLLLLYRMLSLAGAGAAVSLAGAGAVGLIPMFSHMSSGVSLDTLAAALGACTAIAWVRFSGAPTAGAALRLALTLAAAGAVKATAAPVAIALLPLVAVRLPGGLARRLLQTLGLGTLAISTTAIWLLRLKSVPELSPGSPGVQRHGVAAFLRSFRDLPIADHTLKNFLGLIGWTGTGHGDLRWFQISGVFLAVELAGIVVLGALAAIWMWRHDFRAEAPADPEARASWILAGLVFAVTFGWLVSRPAVSPVKLALESLLFALLFISTIRVWRRQPPMPDIVLTSQFTVLVFSFFYFWNVAHSVLLTGQMRGAHGRHFFTLLGFLLLSFLLPAADLLRGWPARNRALAAAICVLLANETAFFATRVFPFYRGRPAAAAPARPRT